MSTSTFFTNPHEYSVHEVLNLFHPLVIPRYQRGYSWEEQEVTAFINDFKDVLRANPKNEERPHFMGTVLFLQRTTKRRTNDLDNEVVDGQQRLTTFSLALIALRNAYVTLSEQSRGEIKDKALREAKKIEDKYLVWMDDEDKTHNRLSPSLANADYYSSLLSREFGESAEVIAKRTRARQPHDSNKKLQAALKQLNEDFVQEQLSAVRNSKGRFETLNNLVSAITKRARVLVLRTSSTDVGYELFAVINNRGRPLSEADLVRTRFIEESERLKRHLPAQCDKRIEEIWSQVLQEGPEYSVDLLHSLWVIRKGTRWSSSRFVNEFINEFLPSRAARTREAQRKLSTSLEALEKAHASYSRIVEGRWPFDAEGATDWRKQRLYLIVRSLGHKQSLPLLLSAALNCDQKTFSQLVFELDRFLFRYVVICKGHASRLGDVLFELAAKLPKLKPSEALSALRDHFTNLLNEFANENSFRTGIAELRYSNRSQRTIKYMLLTLDAYRSNFAKRGDLVPFDESVTVSYDDCWVEHIYPQEAQVGHRNPKMDELKHDIGNLTLGDVKGQRKAGNKPFTQKRKWYKDSGIRDTAEIGELREWNVASVERRRANLVERAVAVWIPEHS